MKKPPLVGTITKAFAGALDGIAARLIRVRRLGYTIELFEPPPPLHTGERLHVSLGECTIDHDVRPRKPVAEDSKP